MASDFVPKRRLIADITNALQALVTTTEDHGYETGQFIRLIVPVQYGMHLDYVQALIEVTSATQFLTDVDTRNYNDFVEPTFPPGFTPAQAVPISGVEDNIAGNG